MLNEFEPGSKALDFVRGQGARRRKLSSVHLVRKQLSPRSNTALGQKMRVGNRFRLLTPEFRHDEYNHRKDLQSP
jgi:hypothetical protein